jgi:hypothetical protein
VRALEKGFIALADAEGMQATLLVVSVSGYCTTFDTKSPSVTLTNLLVLPTLYDAYHAEQRWQVSACIKSLAQPALQGMRG